MAAVGADATADAAIGEHMGSHDVGHLVAQFVPELMDFTVLAPRYCRYSKVTVEVSESPVEIDLGRISQPQAVTHQRLLASELP